MRRLSVIARPIVRLLSASNDFVLRLLRSHPSDEAPVTEDEINTLIQQGTQAGVFHETEQELVEQVFKLRDARADGLMTPRHEVVWLDVEDSNEELRRIVVESGHSRFPVARGSLDEVLGVVTTKSLLAQNWSATTVDLVPLLQQGMFVPESMDSLRVLEALHQSEAQLAVVVDEYGDTRGIVTTGDILEALMGSMPSPGGAASPAVTRLENGVWSVDGTLSMDELKEALEFEDIEPEDQGGYRSLGGFMMTRLDRVPVIGDRVEWARLRFEVLDMDGTRVARVRVQSIEELGQPDADHQPPA
jgi:putative hemolysin